MYSNFWFHFYLADKSNSKVNNTDISKDDIYVNQDEKYASKKQGAYSLAKVLPVLKSIYILNFSILSYQKE